MRAESVCPAPVEEAEVRRKQNPTIRLRSGRADLGVFAQLLLVMVPSAYVMALAVAAPKLPWLGFVALVPLLRAIQVRRPSVALFAGVVWGAALYILGTTVVHTTIVPSLLSLVVLTLAPGIYAFFGARLTRWVGFSPFVLGVGWMLVELSFAPVGLNRGLLAATQGDGLLIGAVGQFLGYVLVAFVVAYTSALLLTVLSGVRFRFDATAFQAGLDEAGRNLWQLIPVTQPCVAAGPIHSRAPPFSPLVSLGYGFSML